MLDAPVRAYLKMLASKMCQKLLETVFLVQWLWSGPLKKKPLLPKKHIMLRHQWGQAYMKQDMKYILFTDETSATLHGPDEWSKGCVGIGVKLHNRFRCHHGRGSVILWDGIIDNHLIGPVKVPAGVKINSAANCELLSDGLFPWLEDHSLSLRLCHLSLSHYFYSR